jgi:Tfp pilus assembly protein PilO
MGPAKFQFAKSQKEKTLLTLLAAVIFIAVYFHLLIRPAIVQLMDLAPKVSTLRRNLSGARTLIKNRPIIERRQSELKQKIDEFEKIFPREREIPKLLEKLSGIAAESGVKIVGTKPIGLEEYGQDDEGEIYQVIPIEIIARSGYHELGDFLQKLEMAKRFVMIKDLKISANASSIKRHNVRIIAETFVLLKR